MNAKSIAVVLRYRDPRRAATWLCEAFGFTLERITEAEPGTIDFICLSYGPSTVLVCPEDHPSGERGVPSERQTCYLTVENIADHYETAKAEGALLERKLERGEDGSELYVCRDPEGHLWSIGTHAFSSPIASGPPVARARSLSVGLAAFTTVVVAGLTAGAVLILSGPAPAPPRSVDIAATESDTELTTGTLGDAPLAQIASKDQEIGELREDLASLQRQHVGQAAAMQRAKNDLAAAQAARAALQSDLAEAQSTVARLQAEADTARQAAADAEARLASLGEAQQSEAKGRDAAVANASQAAAALEAERQAREKAEADLVAAKAAHTEVEAAHQAALQDREAAAMRLKSIETENEEAAASLARTRKALAKANSDLELAEARHKETLKAKDKIIATLNAQLTAKAATGKATPAKPKVAAARVQPPAIRKPRKPPAEEQSSAEADEDTIDPAVLRRCGQAYYERC